MPQAPPAPPATARPTPCREKTLLTENTLTHGAADAPLPMRRGERRKQHTKRRLLDAAAETYSVVGVEGATISAITERADVGLGTFYLHFEDKDAIAASVSALVLRNLLDRERAELDATGPADADPLSVLARVIGHATAQDPGLLCSLLRWDGPRTPRPGTDPDQIALRHSILPLLADRFVAGARTGRYRNEDAFLAAHAVLGVLAGCLPAFVESDRTSDWAAISAFVERVAVSMFRA